MKKRITCAALAAVVAVSSLTASAFAASGLTTNNTMTGSSEIKLPTLDVTVPTEAGFVVNPYKIAIAVTGADNKTASQIVPAYGAGETAWTVINNSDEVALTTNVYAVYKAAKTVAVNATDTSDTTKRYMSLNLTTSLNTTSPTAGSITLVDTAPTAWTGDGSTGVSTFTLAKAGATAGGDELSISLTGSTTDSADWKESDTVSITMGFKFDFIKNVTKNVSFNKNGPTEAANIPVAFEIVEGDKIVKPSTNPTADGYAFRLWASAANGATEYDWDTAVAADTTLYARWAYVVTFKQGDTVLGTLTTKDLTGKVEADSVVDAFKGTAPENKTFAGWATAADATSATYADASAVANAAFTAPTTLYPVYIQS